MGAAGVAAEGWWWMGVGAENNSAVGEIKRYIVFTQEINT
jgi:hypothetical protein